MKRFEYKKLRDDTYKLVGVIGTHAELSSRKQQETLYAAYRQGSEMLDFIDQLGYELGYLNPETNEET